MAQSPAAQDWTTQTADRIESVVGTIRDKTIVPISTVARALVYGIIAGVLGVVALVLLAIGSLRALHVYLPFYVGDSHARSVWVADMIVGGIFLIAGWFLFLRKANARVRKR